MPGNSTTNSWLFPPETREARFDEKWSFVGKKEKRRDRNDADDDARGDCRDHVAPDPEGRLVVSVVAGRRTEGHARLLVEDFHRRTAGRVMDPMTSDEGPAYAQAILGAYGESVSPRPTGRPGRPRKAHKKPPKKLVYATAHKTRENDRVVKVEGRLVHGTAVLLAAALPLSSASDDVNTVFVERHNGGDRHRNSRKVRKTYRSSKDREAHEAVTHFTVYRANFCRPARAPRRKDEEGRWRQRAPAMAAGLADHVWSISEWLSLPPFQR